MLEKEMANMFMNTLPGPYLERLVGCNASNFADVVSTGERVENYLKTYKIQSGGGSSSGVKKPFIQGQKRREGDASAISSYKSRGNRRNNFQNYHQQSLPLGYDANARCSFHSGAPGHNIENCKAFKHHGGANVNMVEGEVKLVSAVNDEDGDSDCDIDNWFSLLAHTHKHIPSLICTSPDPIDNGSAMTRFDSENPIFQAEEEGDEDCELPKGLARLLKQEERVIQPHQESTEVINLGTEGAKREIKIGAALEDNVKKGLIELLQEYVDIFAWSYQDMSGLDTNIVVHRLPLKEACPPVKQKLRRTRLEMVVKIKEEVQKQLDAGFLTVTNYPPWIANIVPVPKKDGKVRMCVDYRDLNRASPKDDFPLPHIDVLVDNTAQFSVFSFMDGFSGYN
ncbi:hypothetical protein KIW84_030220 [Lathyrus oleraceus]|uniref:Uncharacterized protein n=1 Tax=Pisum sativum TaxID=3888 RepID=A0A9D4XRR5_PEA|nr:hypothetical protein KIW84_030220 [Pisum sativum]